jgi:hypothetical protein
MNASWPSSRVTSISTPPVSVNLIALPTRLNSTCRSLPMSEVIRRGASGAM